MQKTDVVEDPKVFHHVGLLVNGPPGRTGLPLIKSSDCLLTFSIREAD
jgi:hypothetical protein